ncbi:DUF4388 domain-containing protein [bacterium]|nr:DUF4388 domain-containing protein [candidate division CSSED10-310 bacterium]
MARGSILLLEQNQKIAGTVEAAARRAGYRFHGLPWGEDIISHLNSNKVDVILMNARQIGSTIRAICTKIRDNAHYRRFPLMIVYGKSPKDERIEYLKMGIDDFMPMPFVPVDLISLVDARLRPFRDLSIESASLAQVDKDAAEKKDAVKVPMVPEKGDLEELSLASIFARLFFNRQSGILNLIIKKETRTIYFENGNVIFAESLSKKDDLGDFLARNGAGSGTGKDILAAHAQAGGPGGDPRELRELFKETNLMDAQSFGWWQSMYIHSFLTSLFSRNLGTFQWHNLPLPDYVNETALEPIHTPHIIMEGIRNLSKWWNYRMKLPPEESIPKFTPRFEEMAFPYGLASWEISMLKVIDGKRNLKEIRELCHRIAQGIDNYIFACKELLLVSFEKIAEEPDRIDIHAELTDDESETVSITDSMTESEESTPDIPASPEHIRGDTGTAQPRPSTTAQSSAQEFDTAELTQPPPKKEPPAPSQGQIESLPVPEIFRLCIRRNFSGTTVFENSDQKKTIYWKKGKIITAESNLQEERLDSFLHERNLINDEQKDSLKEIPEDLINSPNEFLKRGYLTIEQIFSVVRDHTEMMIEDLFKWKEGSYTLTPDINPSKTAVPVDLSPEAAIINGLRKLEDWSNYTQRLPKPDDRIKINRDAKINQSGLKLSPTELRILNILAEPLPANEVSSRVGADADQILHSLYAMEIIGLIQRTGGVS